MKQTIRLTENELKNLIKETILENLQDVNNNQPQPKYNVGDIVGVNYTQDGNFGPDGQTAKVVNIELDKQNNCWMYFCLHTRLPKRGWFREEDLTPVN